MGVSTRSRSEDNESFPYDSSKSLNKKDKASSRIVCENGVVLRGGSKPPPYKEKRTNP